MSLLSAVGIGTDQLAVITRPQDTSTTSNEAYQGGTLVPSENITKVEVTISSNTTGIENLAIYETDGTELANDSSVSSPGDVAVLDGLDLSPGTEYKILGDDNGSSWTFGYDVDEHPYTSSAGDLIKALNGASPSGASDTGQVRVLQDVKLYG